ncbi:hypothetical protein BSR29_05185 [Boudabousia liubingyangii]|uniref:ABC transporter permease n=1 Tax=Boudabousia liubingyangii TaxID=1921764 RepID=A0A1Q5PLE7_9ACTO|nr:ABC transporter permease [Boudabousia liubingyangii]OKL47055.1 hypothetical protein BSR28_06495 [Boudabousia liubingyangii]OKL47884.1 hypothetical protein BSR29_05185 [Boudabousia liubingyangii]
MFSVPLSALLFTLGGSAILLTLTLLMQQYYGLKLGWQPLIAGLRAVVQLAALSIILHGVVQSVWFAVLFVIVMMTIASVTSARRNKQLPLGMRSVPTAIFIAATITITFVFVFRMLDFSVSNLIAVGGIVTGNCMSATTLAGRRFADTSRAQRGQVEAWFALGAAPAKAFQEVSQTAMREMLIPKIDQTKNTGLVTLPGAFVGALLGGAVPLQAARFQLVVLIAIMFAQTLAAIIQTTVLSRATVIIAD